MYSAIRLLQILFAAHERNAPVAGPATADRHRYLECHDRRRLVEPPILYLDGAITGVYREQAMPHDTPSPTHCMLRQRNNDRSRTVIRSHECSATSWHQTFRGRSMPASQANEKTASTAVVRMASAPILSGDYDKDVGAFLAPMWDGSIGALLTGYVRSAGLKNWRSWLARRSPVFARRPCASPGKPLSFKLRKTVTRSIRDCFSTTCLAMKHAVVTFATRCCFRERRHSRNWIS